MKFKPLFTLIILFLISINLFSQKGNGARNAPRERGMGILGSVIDKESKKLVEYANIVVLNAKDSTQVNGGVTNSEGVFKIIGIRPGNYIVKVSFIGFDATYIDNVELEKANKIMDLGEISIQPTMYLLEDAKVVGNKTAIEYKIDKKVINVSQQATTISGTAVDVLETVPSVRVDIEGNVTLRGSGSYTLLIDGRPSVLDANDALQQIPASAIENIEIITNPSAKYDPEGVSGIINIISKNDKLIGFSGIVNGNIGMDERYGADFITTYRTKSYSLNFGADYNTRHRPGTTTENKRTFNDTISSYLNSFGESDRLRNGWSIRAGGNFNLSINDILGVSFRYGDRNHENSSNLIYHNYTEPTTIDTVYKSNNYRIRSGGFFSSNLNYKHTFGADQHEIYAEAMYHKRNSDESTVNEYLESDEQISSGRKNIEIGPGERFRIKVDYTYPIAIDSKFETGAQYEKNRAQDDTKSFIFDNTSTGYMFENEYSYIIDYSRDISSLYGIYSGILNDIGFQAGLRGEYTYRLIELVDSNTSTLIDRIDYFPTFHATYKFNELQQVMASYTSRIRRPRGWQLEPFDVWQDANNIRRGNPSLEPEYIDSFELAFLTNWGESLFSIEAYYRLRKNKIERVRSVYDKDVTLQTFVNVGKDYSFGTELMVNTELLKFWNINLMGDLSHYKLVSDFDGNSLTRENFNWSLRLNNTFQIFESTKFQINGQYNSPNISAQDDYEGYFMTNLALRQELFDKMLSVTLQVRDVFDTAIRKGYSSGPGYESYYENQRTAPLVMLNVSLNLNHFNKKREGNRRNEGDMSDDEF